VSEIGILAFLKIDKSEKNIKVTKRQPSPCHKTKQTLATPTDFKSTKKEAHLDR